MPDMTWAAAMRNKLEDWLASLPDPAYIRVPLARKTIPFSRGVHDFECKGDHRQPIIEYLDEDHTLLSSQVLGKSAVRKDVIHLVVLDGPFWRADMR